MILSLSADHLIWEIINGIFKIIEVNDTSMIQNESSRLDIKLHRKAFVLLMLMINSEEAKKIVYEKIREDKMVTVLSNIIKESKKKLDDLIKQKKQKEEELKTNHENGGDEEYKAQHEREAAVVNENANNFEDDGDDSDSSSDSEDNKQEDDRMMNFHAQHINLLFFTLALIVENDYECARQLVNDNNKDLINIIVQLMQVSEEKDREKKHQRKLVKGACLLVASITSVREFKEDKLLMTQKPNAIQ